MIFVEILLNWIFFSMNAFKQNWIVGVCSSFRGFHIEEDSILSQLFGFNIFNLISEQKKLLTPWTFPNNHFLIERIESPICEECKIKKKEIPSFVSIEFISVISLDKHRGKNALKFSIKISFIIQKTHKEKSIDAKKKKSVKAYVCFICPVSVDPKIMATVLTLKQWHRAKVVQYYT